MGAIAVSKEDEAQIEELMKEMKVKSKASVVRAALQTLREQLTRDRLRAEIQESVRKCARADRKTPQDRIGVGRIVVRAEPNRLVDQPGGCHDKERGTQSQQRRSNHSEGRKRRRASEH